MASLINGSTALVRASSYAPCLPLLRRPRSAIYRTTTSLRIRAAKLPSGVELPKEEPKLPRALWGFTQKAEQWNSRAAMIGIVGLFIVELIIQKGILQVVGFEVGKGLNLPL